MKVEGDRRTASNQHKAAASTITCFRKLVLLQTLLQSLDLVLQFYILLLQLLQFILELHQVVAESCVLLLQLDRLFHP